MPLTFRKNLSFDFFSDEEIREIFHEISSEMKWDLKDKKYNQRYYHLSRFQSDTDGLKGETSRTSSLDIILYQQTIQMIKLKHRKENHTDLTKEEKNIILNKPDLKAEYIQHLSEKGIRRNSSELLFPIKRMVMKLYLKKIRYECTFTQVHEKLCFPKNYGRISRTFFIRDWDHSWVVTTSIYKQITEKDISEFM